MNIIKVSATAARNNFFELLDKVSAGVEVIIEKDKKEVAIITSKKVKMDWKALLKASKKVHGIWKDYNTQDNPLRRKGAWSRLGKWDKGLELK